MVVAVIREIFRVSPRTPIVVGPRRAADTIRVRPNHSSTAILRVARKNRAVWEEQGWVRQERAGTVTYTGEFRVRDKRGQWRTWPGVLRQKRGVVDVAIAGRAMDVLKGHPKGPCFGKLDKEGRWWGMHWSVPGSAPTDALTYVEKLLHEAVNGKNGR